MNLETITDPTADNAETVAWEPAPEDLAALDIDWEAIFREAFRAAFP